MAVFNREEVEDDFEDFLEEVRNRSLAFRSQYSNKSTKRNRFNSVSNMKSILIISCFLASNDIAPDVPREHGGDGQSSEDDFLMTENVSKDDVQEEEWDGYTSGSIFVFVFI